MTKVSKPDAPRLAGVKAGKRLASRKIVKALAKAGDTLALRIYCESAITWGDDYRTFAAVADRIEFKKAAAQSLTIATGCGVKL